MEYNLKHIQCKEIRVQLEIRICYLLKNATSHQDCWSTLKAIWMRYVPLLRDDPKPTVTLARFSKVWVLLADLDERHFTRRAFNKKELESLAECDSLDQARTLAKQLADKLDVENIVYALCGTAEAITGNKCTLALFQEAKQLLAETAVGFPAAVSAGALTEATDKLVEAAAKNPALAEQVIRAYLQDTVPVAQPRKRTRDEADTESQPKAARSCAQERTEDAVNSLLSLLD